MNGSALLVIDVQRSFTRRPYWSESDVPAFLERTQQLIDLHRARGGAVLQVFHIEPDAPSSDPFSAASGLVQTLPGLRIEPSETFEKAVHSAMFAVSSSGESLHAWLRRRGVRELVISGIRTEQCCETTARHASDLGYRVTYAMDATLTFPMRSRGGRHYSVQDIKERTELVLADRFAQVMQVAQLLDRA